MTFYKYNHTIVVSLRKTYGKKENKMTEDKTNTEVEVTSDNKDVKKKEASNRKNKEGAVKNTIDTSPTLSEAKDKTAVVGWGRMNPPQIGHEKLSDKIKSVAKKNNATPLLFLTHSQDAKKNPLSYDEKIRLASKAFGRMVQKSNAKTIIQAMQELDNKYDNIILVVGQDRVKEFDTLLQKYNGRDYTFESIEVVSAGDRDPDAEGVEGMSASKMRALAAAGEMQEFISGLPRKLRSDGEKIYDMIRDGMNITEDMDLEEAMSTQQRLKRSRAMRRNRSKIAAGRRRAARKKPTRGRLKKRAQNRAKNIIRKKVIGKTGKAYKDLSMAQKKTIDKRVAKRKAAINRLAKKLVPKIRKEEFTLNEEFESLFEDKEREKDTPQDSDVKDMPGSQPKGYYKGVEKDKKDDRARHFAKKSKMDDDNPKAYEPAPGDKDAKTKESKHTKKYREMYGEELEEASTKDTQPRKRFHMLLNKNGSPKIDKRFKPFRKKKNSVEENVDALEKQHKAELQDLKREQEAEMDDAKAREKRKEIQKLYKEDFENDVEVLDLINEIWESVHLEESKVEKGLKKKAEKSGVSYSILKDVYDRGVAAWRTGHRPGTTPSQWGYARVNSFLTGGKTRRTADKDLWKKHKESKD
jgi:nicotinic acid mononucleotide adenylyltransferase